MHGNGPFVVATIMLAACPWISDAEHLKPIPHPIRAPQAAQAKSDIERAIGQDERAPDHFVGLEEAEPAGQPRHLVGVPLGLPTGLLAHPVGPPLLARTAVQRGRGPVVYTPPLCDLDEGA